MNRKEKAEALLAQGYNCAQAVAGAFDDVAGVTFDDLMCLTASLGGGVGRSGELCGAANGMALIYGLLKGRFDHTDSDKKAAFAAEVKQMLDEFKIAFGAVRCNDLLEKATDAGMDKKPFCSSLVGFAADTVEAYL